MRGSTKKGELLAASRPGVYTAVGESTAAYCSCPSAANTVKATVMGKVAMGSSGKEEIDTMCCMILGWLRRRAARPLKAPLWWG
jgi:hypothetical protein